MVKEIKRVENYFLKVTGEATHCQPNHWFLPELIDLLLAIVKKEWPILRCLISRAKKVWLHVKWIVSLEVAQK